MIHANPLRGKQAETRKINQENLSIREIWIAKMDERCEAAKEAGDYAALRRMARDFAVIGFQAKANEINNGLPDAYKIPPDVLLAATEL